MSNEENRKKVIKHNAKRNGYFIKMLLCLAMIMIFFKLSIETEGIIMILCFVMVIVSSISALCFRMLHLGMLYCPICNTTFGYSSWFTRTMPYSCPQCGERLNY